MQGNVFVISAKSIAEENVAASEWMYMANDDNCYFFTADLKKAIFFTTAKEATAVWDKHSSDNNIKDAPIYMSTISVRKMIFKTVDWS